VDEHGIWVLDRGSTNGTTVVRGQSPSGALTVACIAHQRYYVRPGDTVVFGERKFVIH
jgi:pSer/pThr/pTyr-binding forkhead associated (FHA) protein